MQYAEPLNGDDNCANGVCDWGFLRHTGYKHSIQNPCFKKYFSRETLRTISRKITELTMGVDPLNRPIIVPESNICGLMSAIYDGYTPRVGDIHSRYIVPSGQGPDNYVQDMIDQVINVAVSQIKTSLETEQQNSSLSIWTSLYGDFNEHGLRQHPPIKVQNKKPRSFVFNMNY